MAAVSVQLQVQVDDDKCRVTVPLQIVLGSVAEIKSSLGAVFPGAFVEVQGESDVTLTAVSDKTTLAELFTALYGQHTAAANELVELVTPLGGPALRLQGHTGMAHLADQDTFREHALGDLSYKLTISSHPPPSPPAIQPATESRSPDGEAMPLQISVLIQTGEKFPVTADSHWSVDSLTESILEQQGWHPDQQRLIFAGKLLEDGRILGDYGLQGACTVHLVVRPDTGAARFRRTNKHIGGLQIQDPYRIQLSDGDGRPCEVWVSAHDSMAVVKYALSLVRPELAALVPAGLSEVDQLRAQLRRARSDLVMLRQQHDAGD